MDNWWVVVICIAAAIVLHGISAIKKSAVLACATLVLHLAAIIALLLIEATLQQLFIFMLASVTVYLAVRMFALKQAIKSEQESDQNEDAVDDLELADEKEGEQ